MNNLERFTKLGSFVFKHDLYDDLEVKLKVTDWSQIDQLASPFIQYFYGPNELLGEGLELQRRSFYLTVIARRVMIQLRFEENPVDDLSEVEGFGYKLDGSMGVQLEDYEGFWGIDHDNLILEEEGGS